jgi:pyrroline-5-carboxylate reductase
MVIGLIGAGNMAAALVRGWGEPVLVADAVPERARALAEEVGGEALESNAAVAERADVVLLAHKPGQLERVAAEIGERRPRALCSILGATRVADVEAAYPGVPVYRVLPNIPAEVGHGVFCYAAGRRAGEGPEQELIALFERLGTVVRLEEPLIEPAMAVMSCGPAFLALVAEALADAGVKNGLQAPDALRLTVETMAGTAAYLRANDCDGPALRHRVTSPGGSTARGLAALERGGVRAAFLDAVDAVVEGTRR